MTATSLEFAAPASSAEPSRWTARLLAPVLTQARAARSRRTLCWRPVLGFLVWGVLLAITSSTFYALESEAERNRCDKTEELMMTAGLQSIADADPELEPEAVARTAAPPAALPAAPPAAPPTEPKSADAGEAALTSSTWSAPGEAGSGTVFTYVYGSNKCSPEQKTENITRELIALREYIRVLEVRALRARATSLRLLCRSPNGRHPPARRQTPSRCRRLTRLFTGRRRAPSSLPFP